MSRDGILSLQDSLAVEALGVRITLDTPTVHMYLLKVNTNPLCKAIISSNVSNRTMGVLTFKRVDDLNTLSEFIIVASVMDANAT